jgi:hypothetical protein
MRDEVNDGAGWTVRVSAGDRKGVRLELSYAGSVQPVTATEGSSLIGTGVLGTLRVNVAPWWSDSFEPFFYLGGGWSRFHLRDQRAAASLGESDDLLQIPFGMGAARRVSHFIVDARAGITIATGANMLPVPRDPTSSQRSAFMHRYGFSVGVGVEL